jgi:multidrug resistance efflux pump
MSDLIKRLRDHEASVLQGPAYLMRTATEAAQALESANARIAELATKCRLYEASLDKSDREADGLKKDAERYRWLRDNHIGDDPEAIELTPAAQYGLDAAIDDAIAKEPK